jgi:hypothetical protein
MTSFFYIVSIAFHTSCPALRKCMDTSRKSLLAESAVTRALPCTFSLDLKDLPPIASLSGPKTWKSLGARSGEYGGCGRHSKDRSWIVATVERAVWGRALSCCNRTPVPRSPHCLDLIAGCRWFLRRSAYIALLTVFPLGKITPRSSQKRVSITFPADGCVRNFLGFCDWVWRHSLHAFLVYSWW